MKTLSAAATLVTRRPYASPRYLLTIEFTDPVPLTLRLADQPFTSLLGAEWLPLVLDWGTIDEALNALDLGGRPAVAEIRLANDKRVAGRARLSDLIRTPFNQAGYEWAFAKATVYEILDATHGTGDERVLGVFYLEEPTEIREDALTLSMSDETLLLAQRNRFVKITTTAFPDADPGVVGTVLPVPFGTLTNVPCHAIVAGYATTLDGAITGVATTVTLKGAGKLAAGGTIQVELEHITLGARTGDTFTGCTRAANSTTAATHPAGASVYEVRTGTGAYRFIPANSILGGVRSITNIRVNGRPAQTSPTVTLADSGLVAGRRLVVIGFTPTNVKNFHLTPINGTAVISLAASSQTWGPLQGPATLAMTRAPGDLLAEAVVESVSRTVTVRYTVNAGQTNGVSLKRTDPVTGELITLLASYDGTSQTFTYATGTSLAAEDIILSIANANDLNITLFVDVYKATVATASEVNETSSTATRVIGTVTCDVEGIQDDVTGSISGSGSGLLARPADIIKATLVGLYGVDPARLAASWAQTRARHVALGYVWAALLTTSDFGELRRLFAEQCRSALFLDGDRWHLKFLEQDPAPDTSIDYDRATVGGQPAEIARSVRTEIKNRIVAYADRDWSKSGGLDEQYRRVTTHEDLGQPGLAEPLPYDLELSFVRDARTANNLGDYWRDWWKRQRWTLELEGFWNLTATEKYDHLTIENHPLLAAHGGTRLVWRVVGKKQHADGRIGLSLVEANR